MHDESSFSTLFFHTIIRWIFKEIILTHWKILFSDIAAKFHRFLPTLQQVNIYKSFQYTGCYLYKKSQYHWKNQVQHAPLYYFHAKMVLGNISKCSIQKEKNQNKINWWKKEGIKKEEIEMFENRNGKYVWKIFQLKKNKVKYYK